MALEYRNPIKFEKIAPILEEYAQWFSNISLSLAYDEALDVIQNIHQPSSFKVWVEEASREEQLPPAVMANIIKIHDEMVGLGQQIIEALKRQDRPEQSVFVGFKDIYAAFLMHIRRLERDSAMDGSGIDEVTGLRSASVIESDLKKEMERVSRQGNPFSLVVMRIDRFVGQKSQDRALSMAVENVKRCMRSFDDAYYLGQGMFLLSLKHADIIGAQAAVGRLQNFLIEDEGNIDKMTMSYCMAEPVAGDDIKLLLKNMKQDLVDHLNDMDAVLKFVEVSALERYVSKMEEA